MDLEDLKKTLPIGPSRKSYRRGAFSQHLSKFSSAQSMPPSSDPMPATAGSDICVEVGSASTRANLTMEMEALKIGVDDRPIATHRGRYTNTLARLTTISEASQLEDKKQGTRNAPQNLQTSDPLPYIPQLPRQSHAAKTFQKGKFSSILAHFKSDKPHSEPTSTTADTSSTHNSDRTPALNKLDFHPQMVTVKLGGIFTSDKIYLTEIFEAPDRSIGNTEAPIDVPHALDRFICNAKAISLLKAEEPDVLDSLPPFPKTTTLTFPPPIPVSEAHDDIVELTDSESESESEGTPISPQGNTQYDFPPPFPVCESISGMDPNVLRARYGAANPELRPRQTVKPWAGTYRPERWLFGQLSGDETHYQQVKEDRALPDNLLTLAPHYVCIFILATIRWYS